MIFLSLSEARLEDNILLASMKIFRWPIDEMKGNLRRMQFPYQMARKVLTPLSHASSRVK